MTKSTAADSSSPRQRAPNPVLVTLGERVRALRERRGITRKSLAASTGVSERHLANLEYGDGNPSVLVLQQVADALDCALAELTGDVTTRSPEWLLLRSLLQHRDEATLRRVRIAIADLLDEAPADSSVRRIALIGLRGAGKSTLGQMLARELGFEFVELSREIEALAGCSIGEIQALYGAGAYRRHERRALEQVIDNHREVVIATPGGLVSEAATFNLLLAGTATVWLQARPEDHMLRVIEQGDFRPMAGSDEAMSDLRSILSAREPFYSKASYRLDTSTAPLADTFASLHMLIRQHLHPEENPS
ncbi:MAG: helix-turn-helix transcriptional regulator [Gammaproteobacteria bacterium]|nr:helix-turn-helix transcriptional regulator [Gammaproteobacteria bacterium]